MAVHLFHITRPVVSQEYDASGSVVEVEEEVTLTNEQTQSLSEEFSRFIHELYPTGEIEILDVQFDQDPKGQLIITLGSMIQFTPDQWEEVEQEFDHWFVDELARHLVSGPALPSGLTYSLLANKLTATWQFDLIPHQRWVVLAYRTLTGPSF